MFSLPALKKRSFVRYHHLDQEPLDIDANNRVVSTEISKSCLHVSKVRTCAVLLLLAILLAQTRSYLPAEALFRCDPFAEPGYVHYDEAHPASTQWRPLSSTCDPAPDWLGLLSRLDNRSSELDFLRGRTALIIGDSTDRQTIEDLASITQSRPPKAVSYYKANMLAVDDVKMRDIQPHGVPRLLYYEELDFRVISVFHYGLMTDLRLSQWIAPDVHKPLAMQDRLTELFRPLVEMYTDRLDLVRFQSGLWDVDALTALPDDVLHAHEGNSSMQSARQDEEAMPIFTRYTLRYKQALGQIQAAFPHAAIWARTMHRPGPGLHKEHFSDISVKRLSQAAVQGARESGVNVFDFGNIFEGWQIYANWIHPYQYPGTALMAQALIHELYLEFEQV
ncbi:uncharacterized protein L969DRAFT_52996 [Mixia osmundae IAM 14324]|uniref:uncharacterized protein n=1 Tax=Mixia osmundae (strain CBS 9802 / IAM 14324 / JCM 22182 / KY 12970) TaxID=764103 RepID=UPI0004A5502A|nr:uncharacterized protein L969DRAFT_52996 [Mixia osmundae IAM 14324]KEI37270.1 hypothetical protein L969DRAFT_52996 [Mixia osmundae IAM 14324]